MDANQQINVKSGISANISLFSLHVMQYLNVVSHTFTMWLDVFKIIVKQAIYCILYTSVKLYINAVLLSSYKMISTYLF